MMDTASREIGSQISQDVIGSLHGAMNGKSSKGNKSYSVNLTALLARELAALPFDLWEELLEDDRK